MHLQSFPLYAAAWFLSLGSLLAQDPPQQDPAAETPVEEILIPSDHEGKQVLELTLEDALRLAGQNNLDLKAGELLPMESIELLNFEEAFFEPELFADARYSRSRDPQRDRLAPSIRREVISGDVGVRSQVATGGLFELSYGGARSVQSAFGFPDRQYSNALTASITQPLLRGFGSDYALRRVRTARADMGETEAVFEQSVQDTLLRVAEAYWELAFAREDYRVLFQAYELAQEQLRITEERIRVRDLAERDRVADEAEVARRFEELIRAENLIRQREDILRELLFDDSDGELWGRNLQPITSIREIGALPPAPWQEYVRVALANRPELLARRFSLRKAEIDLETAKRDLLPQFDVVGSYTADGVDGDLSTRGSYPNAWRDARRFNFPDWSVAVQMSMPIGNSAARANERRAELEVERERRLLYADEQEIQLEVRDAILQLNTFRESIRASEESVRLAETVLDTERERLKVGRTTIFEVQQRNQELREARSQLLRNQLDYQIAEDTFLHAQGVLEVPEGGSR
ncbi:MAG: TolC family protein [Planctomycetota bacterium]|jgi:outer membrane protein TolC